MARNFALVFLFLASLILAVAVSILVVDRETLKDSLSRELASVKSENARLQTENAQLQNEKTQLQLSLQEAQEQVHWARVRGRDFTNPDTNWWAVETFRKRMDVYEDYAQRGFINRWEYLKEDVFLLLSHIVEARRLPTLGELLKPSAYAKAGLQRMKQYLTGYAPNDEISWQELKRLQSRFDQLQR